VSFLDAVLGQFAAVHAPIGIVPTVSAGVDRRRLCVISGCQDLSSCTRCHFWGIN